MSHDDTPGVGHNQPPEPTPFEAVSTEIENLYLEAKNWCDGEDIENQAQADQVGKLINLIRAAAKRADELRAEEKAPLDEQVKAIQERYAPLIADTKSAKGKTVLALQACKDALAPYLEKQERERREAEARARETAEKAAREAEEAARAARSLEEKEAAEAMIQEAKTADKVARNVARMSTNAGTGEGRRVGLRVRYQAEITDEAAFAKFVWQHHRAQLLPAFQDIAQDLVDGKHRDIPGVTIHERRSVA